MEHDVSSSPAQEGEISVRVPVGAGGKTLVFLLRLLPDQAVPALLQRDLPALIEKAAEEKQYRHRKAPAAEYSRCGRAGSKTNKRRSEGREDRHS
jgi:hypothetical protein